MQAFRKTFHLIDFLRDLKEEKLTPRALLFIISLIAFSHEKDRKRGRYVTIDISEPIMEYSIKIKDSGIIKKFGFSIDTIFRIRDDLEKSNSFLCYFVCIYFRGRKYSDSDLSRRYKKNYDREYVYGVKIGLALNKRDTIPIPTRIIYDKNLATREKLAIIWNLSLKGKNTSRQPKLKEIEKASGISERTIRKAKKKYPQLFNP